MREFSIRIVLFLFAVVAGAQPSCAQDASPVAQDAGQTAQLSAAELFEFADRARDAGDLAAAEIAYQALAQDLNPELRTEARFRLARMYAQHMDRKRDAAVLLRRILDDKPDAGPVRLELARILAELGEFQSARRELRAARAGGLPPEVEQRVRFFANALSATKLYGGEVELAFAPSTNINRGTRSDTLGTVIGDFVLDEDAQAQSGMGLALKGQAYARVPLGGAADLLLRSSAAADLYRQSRFDDFNVSLQAGPQWTRSSGRLALALATNWRWYGLDPYSKSYGLTGNWQHPLDGRSQVRIDGSALKEDNQQNDLQDGERYSVTLGLDRALSARAGTGVDLTGSRNVAKDPGYTTISAGLGGYLYRELGRTTAVLTASYRHLQADARLLLYPGRRIDNNISVVLSGTFRELTFGTLATLVRFRYERNWSTAEIYRFDRFGVEFGLTSAF